MHQRSRRSLRPGVRSCSRMAGPCSPYLTEPPPRAEPVPPHGETPSTPQPALLWLMVIGDDTGGGCVRDATVDMGAVNKWVTQLPRTPVQCVRLSLLTVSVGRPGPPRAFLTPPPSNLRN